MAWGVCPGDGSLTFVHDQTYRNTVRTAGKRSKRPVCFPIFIYWTINAGHYLHLSTYLSFGISKNGSSCHSGAHHVEHRSPHLHPHSATARRHRRRLRSLLSRGRSLQLDRALRLARVLRDRRVTGRLIAASFAMVALRPARC